MKVGSGASGVVVQDCEINGVGTGNDGSSGIAGQGTFLRNNIYNVENGISVQGDGSVIEGNYIHDLKASGSPHYDGIQIHGASDTEIRGNTIINDHGQTSAVFIQNEFGPVDGVTVDGNLLVGGGYTVYSDGTRDGGPITNVSFTNNHMGEGQWGYTYFYENRPVYEGNTNDGHELVSTLDDQPTPRPEPEPEPEPEPRPEPEPEPEPEPRPEPEPEPEPRDGYPHAGNTGVPDGVTLTPSGDISVNEPGVVLDGLDIRGTVYINADNVTLQNSKVTSSDFYVVKIADGVTGAVVQDCEIDGTGTGNGGSSGIGGQGTFLRNNIHNVENGISVQGDGAVIQGNYIHDLKASGSPHYDGIQIHGASDIDISGNTIINDHGQTAAVFIQNHFGPVDNVSVDDNILVGGGYTVYSDGTRDGGPITNVSFTNNHMGEGQWGYTYFYENDPVYEGNTNDGHDLVARLGSDPLTEPDVQPGPQPDFPEHRPEPEPEPESEPDLQPTPDVEVSDRDTGRSWWENWQRGDDAFWRDGKHGRWSNDDADTASTTETADVSSRTLADSLEGYRSDWWEDYSTWVGDQGSHGDFGHA
ncbi:TonB, C-terminal domain protein [Lutibaculum baratangense AMV1]|uniref:TonB, C-terminal domain protein n=1 Tax=Lutibaculum baratangense AMV1 TaxID=631454 RepID=V4T960_9HYPH|nr:TonB, C-terminal domain protein [Lutibaculum baratangense AMV1]